MSWGRGLELLKGSTIKRVLIDSAHETIGFELADGTRRAFYTEGDCCSQSWIENITNVSSLIDGTVANVEEVDMGDVTSDCEDPPQEYVQSYSVKVFVEGRPTFELEFRNASNGYYGGSLCETKNDGKAWAELAPLTEDF